MSHAGASAASPVETQRREIIRQVAMAIGELATHLSSDSEIANAISAVSIQAKEIAFKAWRAIAGGQGQTVTETVQQLTGDLTRLANQMMALAERAGRETVISRDAASALVMAAAELSAIADDIYIVRDVSKLRARLRPLATKLETIPARLLEGKAIAEAFEEGAKVAASLAVRGANLAETGDPGAVLQAVFDGVSGLADQARQVSTWITANARQGQRVAAMMKAQIDQLPRSNAGPGRAAAGEELSTIIHRGAAIIW